LLEPQRTNLLPDSEHFGSGEWSKGNLSLSANAATSPEGLDNAYEVTFTDAFHFLLDGNISVSSNTQYTFSFYVKRGTATDLKYRLRDATNSADIIAPTSYYSQTSASEWKRIEVTFTTPATCTSLSVYTFSDGGVLGTAYLYGAQLEAGSYATSYIPTYGSAVTRNADDCSKTGIASLYGSNVGTLFYEGIYGNEANEVYLFAQNVLGTATTDSVYLQRSEANKVQTQVWDGPNQVVVIKGGNINIGDTFKAAVAFADNDVVLYLNGVQIGTDTNVNIPPLTSLQIGRYPSSNNNNYKTSKPSKQVLLFPTRLSNEELAALTTI
jgi:hypothetical protein